MFRQQSAAGSAWRASRLIANAAPTRRRSQSPFVRTISNVPYVAGTFPLSPDHTSEDVSGFESYCTESAAADAAVLRDDLHHQLLLGGGGGRLGAFALASQAAWLSAANRSSARRHRQGELARSQTATRAGRLPTQGAPKRRRWRQPRRDDSRLRHWHEQAADGEAALDLVQRFHSVAESTQDSIVSTNAHGAITFSNRRHQQRFSIMTKAAALGTSFEHLLHGVGRTLYLAALAVGTDAAGANFGQTIELTSVAEVRRPLPDGNCPCPPG